MHIEQKFGGHLGFYEGGFVMPNSVTWLDRTAVDITDALVSMAEAGKDKVYLKEEDELFSSAVGSDEESSLDEDSTDSSGSSSSESSPMMAKRSVARPRFVCKRQGMKVTSSLRGAISARIPGAI